jgi:hypothetical protein
VTLKDRPHLLYGRRQTLSDEEIVRLYAELGDSDRVGYMAGCSGTTVLNRVRAAGQPVLKPGHSRTKARLKLLLSEREIIELYAGGQSGPAIATLAGCSTSHVYLILSAAGIRRRRPADALRRKRAGRGS